MASKASKVSEPLLAPEVAMVTLARLVVISKQANPVNNVGKTIIVVVG